MATLLLTAVGTAIGGPLGGALGALVGRQVDTAVFGGRRSEGPRLKELTVQTSSYGSALPLHFGRVRAAGTVIWSTELVEHREKQGGGKGRPSVTAYSYTTSFAVALSSRPIAGVGRIWADGNLLRGAAGDLKVGGSMRVHRGYGDQAVDPLIAQAEGPAQAPAFRNTACVVFEDLELAEFGNRLPSLTFEIFGDDTPTSVAAIAAAIADGAEVSVPGRALGGFTIDRGNASDVLTVLSDAFPVSYNAWGETLSIDDAEALPATALPMLPEPATARADTESGHQTGTSGRRAAQPQARLCGLRYYDIDRDYQPGMQRGRGRAEPGELSMIELPAALDASYARTIADAASRRLSRPGETARYRITELDSRFGPGKLVTLPGRHGTWRVDQWEWQAAGIDLSLVRLPNLPEQSADVSDPGRFNMPADLGAVPTILAACELPWDGLGAGDRPAIFAAASASSAGWSGAALFVQRGGVLTALRQTGRRRAVIGTAVTALPSSSPLLLDRTSTAEIQLAATDLALLDADFSQLAAGSNRALLGSEIIQFAAAEPLGAGRWRISGLLRGRGGTEAEVSSHLVGEPFVLIDDALLALDPQTVGEATSAQIYASGLGDAAPVIASILHPGITLRPLPPVHGKAKRMSDGSISMAWVRRARGAWIWPDGVDAPLAEQAEAWEVAHVAGMSRTVWQTAAASLILPAAQTAALPANGSFEITQIGSFARSRPLPVAFPV